jgi:hypothetical protein
MHAQNKGNDQMKKLYAAFAALLITAPALAGDASQGNALVVPAANNMATAQVAIGAVATKLVGARAGRLLLQVECIAGPVFIGLFSSVTTKTGFPLPPIPGNYTVGMTFNNYAGQMYAFSGVNGNSCVVLEIY